MILRCKAGTSSAGNSTPKSPRATITASASATIASRSVMALGFSIFAKIPARLPTSWRSSTRSLARCTKDKATQSTPRARPKARSSRSLRVKADKDKSVSGKFTPLRSEIRPPTTTIASKPPSVNWVTVIRSLPSSIIRSCPTCSSATISAWGKGMVDASPVSADAKCSVWPLTTSTGPCANLPMRILGPCRSCKIPSGLPSSCSTLRICAKRSWWSAWLPWLKFRRKTFTPSKAKRRILSRSKLDGPSVATILVQRGAEYDITFLEGLKNQSSAKIVHIRTCRPCGHQIT